MDTDRRQLLLAAAALAGAGPLAHAADEPRRTGLGGIRAVAFDAFALLDGRGVVTSAESLFPGKGAALVGAWRTRQFEYAWLRVSGGRYRDFRHLGEDALEWAASSVQVTLTRAARDALLKASLELPAWPDSAPALRTLRAAGLRLAYLSNFTSEMLEIATRSARLEGLLDLSLSTDQERTYKPDPRAYRMAVDAFRLPREQIAFAAFAGWDAAGARWFGYPTIWVNRGRQPAEVLDGAPDATVGSVAELAALLERSRGTGG